MATYGGAVSLVASNNWVVQGATSNDLAMFVNRPDQGFVFGTSNPSAMLVRITSNGNVGVGTSNPEAQLHVTCNMRVDGSLQMGSYVQMGGIDLFLGTGLSNAAQVVLSSSNIQGYSNLLWAGSNGTMFSIMSNTSNDAFYWTTGPSSNEVMRLTGPGRVSIGPSNPDCPLQVISYSANLHSINAVNQANSNVQMMFTSKDGSLSAGVWNGARIETGWQSGITSWSSNYFKIQTHATNTASFTDDFVVRGGNVGIGTANPTSSLHVSGKSYLSAFAGRSEMTINDCWTSVGDTCYIRSDPLNSLCALRLYTAYQSDTAAGGYLIKADTGNGTPFCVQIPNHRVGINTASPQHTLDVSGSIRAYGGTLLAQFITVTQNPTIGGPDFISISQRSGIAQGWNTSSEAPIYLGKSATTNRTINASGTLNASGADYAEYMKKSDLSIAFSKGDIVGINGDGLLSASFSDAVSFGIKSTDPSFVGSDVWEGDSPVEPEAGCDDYDTKMIEWRQACEDKRAMYDRVAFSGRVPVNVYGAKPGEYVVPYEKDDGSIGGMAVGNVTFEQYKIAVGKVISVLGDGRAVVIVKVV